MNCDTRNSQGAFNGLFPFVRLGAYKGSVVEYIVRVWCKNADYWDVHFDLNENVRESFKANGVAMSYEHVNVHVIDK